MRPQGEEVWYQLLGITEGGNLWDQLKYVSARSLGKVTGQTGGTQCLLHMAGVEGACVGCSRERSTEKAALTPPHAFLCHLSVNL